MRRLLLPEYLRVKKFSCIYKGFDNFPARILAPEKGSFQAFSGQITENFALFASKIH